MSVTVEVARDQLATFVDALLRHADQGSWLSLRAFRDDMDNEPPFDIRAIPINGDLDRLVSAVDQMARRCAAAQHPIVFCPPVATFSNRAKADEASLANGLALSVELDKDAERSRKRLEFLLGPATVVVASGGTWMDSTGVAQPKLHVHWRLREPTRTPEAHARLKRARAMATALVGGDASNKPSVHPIRWPGSVHRKREPKLCQIIACNPEQEIDLQAALAALLDIQPEFRKETPNGQQPGDGEDRETSELVRALLTGADYHSTLLALAMRYLKRGMAADQVGLTLRGIMEAIPLEHRDGDQPGRWQARYADIGRTIRTGQSKLAEQATATDAWPEPLDIIGAPELVGWPELPAECLPVPLLPLRHGRGRAAERRPLPARRRMCWPPAPHRSAMPGASNPNGTTLDAAGAHLDLRRQGRGPRGTEMIRSAFWPIKEREAKLFEQWQREHAAWKRAPGRPQEGRARRRRSRAEMPSGSRPRTPRSRPRREILAEATSTPS